MTLSSTINIPGTRFIHWMNVIRDTSDDELRYDLLECFWESQVKSKYWMVEELKQLESDVRGIVYVFGGWHGLAAMTLIDNFSNIETIYSIDKNPACVMQGNILSNNDSKIFFLTDDMSSFKFYSKDAGLIVNTSTEHITQEDFDSWLTNVPDNVLIVLQGNNYKELVGEHIRTTDTLQEFKEKNSLGTILFAGELDCKQFTRYMVIGYKNEL